MSDLSANARSITMSPFQTVSGVLILRRKNKAAQEGESACMAGVDECKQYKATKGRTATVFGRVGSSAEDTADTRMGLGYVETIEFVNS